MINFLGITARIQGIFYLFLSLHILLINFITNKQNIKCCAYFFLEIFNATLAIREKTIGQNMININCSRQSVLGKGNTKIPNK